MSSDYEFDDIDLDTLTQLDVIESTQPVRAPAVAQPPAQPARALARFRPAPAAQAAPAVASTSTSNANTTTLTRNNTRIASPPPTARSVPVPDSPPAAAASDDYDQYFDADESTDFAGLDAVVADAYAGKRPAHEPQAVAGPSNPRTFARVPSTGTRQTTLFGGIVPEKPTASNANGAGHAPLQRAPSAPKELFRKTKKWDHTAFSKTGNRKKKGKARAAQGEEGEEEEEEIEFEQFPAPFINPAGYAFFLTPKTMKLQPDLLEIKKWWYPTNVPKRDYQFNISRNCLFDNTLVSLPTGLGKTFIAGVVMLNYYKWFPEGKVVFVAPTKPLVAQQIDACHKTCGIPGRDAIELTGEVTAIKRGDAWAKKRVFYMTPQTLMNDLTKETCDARDIVLLVIDEAHKATGGYAYATVVRHLMSKNPFFRVLALSATPGSNTEAVQDIVDALHISRIEIRDENSLDIRGYIKTKEVKLHKVKMNEGAAKIANLLGRAMAPIINDAQSKGLCQGSPDPIQFNAYRAQMAQQQINTRKDKARLTSMYPALKRLGILARAMGYLLEGTVRMCYESLKENMETTNKDGKPNALGRDSNAQAAMRELERQAVEGFAAHPKMEVLKTILIQYFAQNMPDPDAPDPDNAPAINDSTCAMVFTNNRAAVEEIVEYLAKEAPLLRPTHFIGQSTDKKGNKGLAQRDQLDIIKRFKKGEFNVMVSTSIGEEGLDIGEVDMVVCYEAPKTPVRMLQRVGRTGRKRQGYVHVLLAEGREDGNWEKANERYADIQQTIMGGKQLEFYGDVERLLPENARPECCEQVMLIEEYDREANTARAPRASKAAGPKGTKRKRGDDIPAGALSGFVSARTLKPKRKKDLKFDEGALEDDDTDAEIEAGSLFAAVRRTQSAPAAKPKKAAKGGVKRTKTAADKTKAAKPKQPRKRKKTADTRDFEQQGMDDSDDAAIARGLKSTSVSEAGSPSRRSSPDIPLQRAVASSSRGAVLDICTTEEEEERSPAHLPSSDPAPARFGTPPAPHRSSRSMSSTRALSPEPQAAATEDLGWLLGSDDEDMFPLQDDDPAPSAPAPPPRRPISPGSVIEVSDSEIEIVADVDRQSPVRVSSPPVILSPAPPIPGPSRHSNGLTSMPPPANLPVRFNEAYEQQSELDDAEPTPSFPIGGLRGRKRPRPAQPAFSSSSPQVEFSPALKRLQRGPRPAPQDDPLSSPSVQRPTKKLKKIRVYDTAAIGRRNPFLDVQAGHSGDEHSEGSDDGGDPDLSSEGDRSFFAEPGATQVSPSYNQAAVYRQSLMTQAPGGGPQFRGGPARPAYAQRERAQRAPLSSDGEHDSEPDEYEMDSFIVDDEADISYDA